MTNVNVIDPSEHLKLIHRVIHQMGLHGDEAEEAYSESLVAITTAAQTYDPGKGVPLANWLAKNIRWGIQNWRHKQRPSYPIMDVVETPRDVLSARTDFKAVLTQVEKLLTPLERQVILAGAWGYSGKEIARALKITEVEVSRAKTRARAKLEQIR